MDASDSEESDRAKGNPKEEIDGTAPPPAPEGAVIAERTELDTPVEEPAVAGTTGTDVAKPGSELGPSAKASNTLFIRNVPADFDVSDLEMRLLRFGDMISLQKEDGGLVVAKFQRTNSAFQAKEKLHGSTLSDSIIQVEFGPQEADHYSRNKKRTQGRGKAQFLDGGIAQSDAATPRAAGGSKKTNAEKHRGSTRAWGQDGETGGNAEADGAPGRRRKAADAGLEDGHESKMARKTEVTSMTCPTKPVSRWSEELTFEVQLEDFMKMPRRGMYNRYLVLGKLPPELRTGSAIWHMVAPVQRDIMHIEMLTCFGKPVAHVALRSATAAAAMHRIAVQLHPNLTVAFAPPRRAAKALWLGNVDDFVNRKDLEVLLNDFGKVVNGMRYLPARTCAFATFTDVSHAVKARNFLYGLEVQKNQYLNVDFIDEWAAEVQEGAAWPGVPGPWAPPHMVAPWAPSGPWGAPPGPPPPWQQPSRGKRGEQQQQMDPWGRPVPPHPGMPVFPPPGDRDGKERRKRRSRSRSARRRDGASPDARRRDGQSPFGGGLRGRDATGRRGASESEAGEPRVPKARVKLYKMGEFCCNIVANFVKGKDDPDLLVQKLHIDQRTKIDHCKSHLERAGGLASIWHFSAADRKDCAAYDALCDYFVEKQRVGLVQTPSCYVYIVPPTEKYLKELKLPNYNFVVGLQIPIKK